MKLEDVNTQPEIIVLIGLPGSGKSTWRAKMLAKTDKDYIIVSSDDEIERMAKAENITYDEIFKKALGAATHALKQKFKDAINNGRNIIWDQTNLSLKKRRGILQQVPANYRKIAVSFEITTDELQKRLDKREKETGKSIPPKVLKGMANSYVPPSKEEGFDEVLFV